MDSTAAHSRSSSRQRLPSRPTTPLRPSSRSSFREAHGYGGRISHAGYSQPAINALEPQFAELADSMADLEANFMHLQLMHESLTRFRESFASFLYGMNMNAFCVDFSEVSFANQAGILNGDANGLICRLLFLIPSKEPNNTRQTQVS